MIDSHFHIWNRARASGAAGADRAVERWSPARPAGILEAPYLRRDVTFEQLAAAAGPDLEAAIEIEVDDFADGVEEARFVAAVAARDQRLRAHIAWAQLESESLGERLDRLVELPVVRGVRRTCQIEADPEFCARPAYIRGARMLGERGLLCEICVRLGQVSAVPRLAAEAPETRIVLQHVGKPDLTAPPTAGWLRAIEALGALPNVDCKLSVVVHSESDEPYRAERLAPYVEHAVACFGWRRLVYGSNWPVSTAVIGYPEWVDMLTGILAGCGAGPKELAAVFGENARALYRL